MATAVAVQGRAWDLDSEYPAPDSAEMNEDLAQLDTLLGQVEKRNEALIPLLDGAPGLALADAASAVKEAQAIFALLEEATPLLDDPDTYAECRLSVDSQDEPAQALLGRLLALKKRFANASQPLSQFLDLVGDDIVDAYLAHPSTEASRFLVTQSRKRRGELLPLAQETLVNNLAQDGIHAWGRLYDQLSGTLTCDVTVAGEARALGIAEASGLMLSADDAARESAWRGINRAWGQHSESCAAAINAIAGWRLAMCRQRSENGLGNGDVHFLDAPVHMNRLARETLETLLGVARQGVPLARRAASLQARAYRKSHYGPWDQRAPAPVLPGAASEPIDYADAIDLIAGSYASIDAEMGDFVRMMAQKGWIEGTVGPRKRPGAYCTSFHKSRTPRVYSTYTGGASDVITLAHELGHAYHAWVMRDLPDSQRGYGMSIAETASTFGETVVREALLERAESPAAQLDIAWEEASALVAFVLNIPTRFEFEKNFYQARDERPQRPDELNAMMSAAWQSWYGDCLAEPDPLFWANKLHFYISGLSFYNFPYLFGYLFSLGVHARRAEFGDEFFARYRALLMDTGRMTAEELAAKHLEVDLTRPDFWQRTLTSLTARIDNFERLVEQTAADG